MNYKVHIQELPFEEIIRSAYETLKVECQGVLFGEQQEKRSSLNWIVESAHPIQLAKRSPSTSIPQDNERGNWSLIFGKVGEYHSHPWDKSHVGLIKLTEKDKNGLMKDKTEIIVTIRSAKVIRKINQNPFLLSGYVFEGDNVYRIDLGAYCYNGRIRRAEISAPKRVLKMIQ